ncbi:MAG: phenylacetate-CoA oxygenase subunit PaaC [Gemmatimonadaceae bacterium]|nr:phenylacetate-CoA oxygenase subunit PaaC [Gemmatimonadaceae bacterium]MCW5826186.1 phenylacetate-CoA oxygenase subunit PaaC [Gemmatimonadaceae bacterium]
MANHEGDAGGIAAGEATAGTVKVAGARGPAFAAPMVEYLLRLGDDRLILGHRMSEWTGHGPILEEDIATANIALDLIGQAAQLLKLAGEVEGKGRSEDALAYFRDGTQFRNCLLVELPRGDFGDTMLRQFLFDAYSVLLLDELSRCGHTGLAAIAAKALKESKYHLRHSSEWVLRLGDGTEESHRRIQASLDRLWKYTGELFTPDAVDEAVAAEGVRVDVAGIKSRWDTMVDDVLTRATLTKPADAPMQLGGRRGRHTEHIGHLLAMMQSVARAHPGATW